MQWLQAGRRGTCESRSGSQSSWSRVLHAWIDTSSARRSSVHSSAVVSTPALAETFAPNLNAFLHCLHS